MALMDRLLRVGEGKILKRLKSIADQVNAKATVIPQGLTAELAARGEVALAIQQVSELMAVPGIEVVGRLPAGANTGAVFSAAVFTGAEPEGAATLEWLAAALTPEVLRAGGLEPVEDQGAVAKGSRTA